MFVQTQHTSPQERPLLSRFGARLSLLAVLSAILIAFTAGCGSDSTPTGVEVNDSLIPQIAGSIGSTWTVLASVAVEPGGDAVELAGGRYVLSIPAGAVSQPAVITLSEAVDGAFLFEFSPVGLTFDEAVVLHVDYAATRFDPDSRDYDSSQPQLWVVDGDNVAV